MAERLTPDICVIGAGSGGLTVAAAAAAFGVSVVLIERARMGGDCLNYGCVPSKALLAAAKHAHAIGRAPVFGVSTGAVEIDFAKVHDHIHAVIAAIAPNDSEERFAALGVTVLRESAYFIGPRAVKAGNYDIRARRFVIATGSSPLLPPIPGLPSVDPLTNETIFERKTRPDHLVIIGGGPIGMEMAQAHRRLGADVTVLEAARALGKDDPELACLVVDRLREEGITILEGAKVSGVKRLAEGGRVRVAYETADGDHHVDGSDVLVAVGRAPNVFDLDLDAAGVEFDKRGIKVGANLRTTNKAVYAIGDVTGGLQFTHVAGYHAGLVVQQILFRLPARENRAIIPWTTYTDPELAHVGLDEQTARQRHGKIHVLRWPYAENDRAQAERRTGGLIKLVADRKGRVLGATIAGADAGEMIHLWALAVAKSLKVSDIRAYVAPYPTLGEIGKRAAISYYAPMTRKPILRRLIGFLQGFG